MDEDNVFTEYELNEKIDEMIREINSKFKKEFRDDITRKAIMSFILNNYSEYFDIDNVMTHCYEDVKMKKADCFYWLFVLTCKKIKTDRIYIQI